MEFFVVTAKDKSTTSSRYKKESREAHNEREKKKAPLARRQRKVKDMMPNLFRKMQYNS